MPDKTREEAVTAYYRVRTALGVVGFALPFALVIMGYLAQHNVAPSISDYYHTVMRDLFVGAMCTIGLFLLVYTGHRRKAGEWFSDDLVSSVAGLAALGVAFFPNESPEGAPTSSLMQIFLGIGGTPRYHYICAMVFFLCLFYICNFKFAKTARTYRKYIYLACGWTILAMTVAIIVSSYLKFGTTGALHNIVLDWMLVLVFEALAVWAFSIAWLVKGKADQIVINTFRKSKPPAGLA